MFIHIPRACTHPHMLLLTRGSRLIWSLCSLPSAFSQVSNPLEVEQLRCKVPPGVGAGLPPVLLLPTLQSKNPLGLVFSYEAPQIRLLYVGPWLSRADMKLVRLEVDRLAPPFVCAKCYPCQFC